MPDCSGDGVEVSLFQHTLAFFRSFVLGGVLFGLYMVFELIRIMAPPGRLRLFLEDVLFMLLAAVLNFLFALSQTYGSIRLFSLLAQLAAFSLLYFTVGRLIKKFSAAIRSFLIRAYHFVYDPVTRFLGKLVSGGGRLCRFFMGKIKIVKKEKN